MPRFTKKEQRKRLEETSKQLLSASAKLVGVYVRDRSVTGCSQHTAGIDLWGLAQSIDAVKAQIDAAIVRL